MKRFAYLALIGAISKVDALRLQTKEECSKEVTDCQREFEYMMVFRYFLHHVPWWFKHYETWWNSDDEESLAQSKSTSLAQTKVGDFDCTMQLQNCKR